METKTYLHLLILSGTLSQAIVTSEASGKSLEPHSRQKRVINKYRNENNPVSLEKIPYIVNIHANGSTICGGSILSAITILSAAHCFVFLFTDFKIIAASNHKKNGTSHTLLRKIVHPQWNYHAHSYDLVLLVISPPIDLIKGPNQKIDLYNGNLPVFSHGTFSGWGCHTVIWGARFFPNELRSTTIPIISRQECQRYYRTKILDTHMCTFDRSGHRGTCFGDDGGPLAVLGKLVGILTWNKQSGYAKIPDVFINVAEPTIRKWIHFNTQYVY